LSGAAAKRVISLPRLPATISTAERHQPLTKSIYGHGAQAEMKIVQNSPGEKPAVGNDGHA
jgi:hypothetical protein